ncbi:MAG: SGNH/GDSL hydrolase family protein [candidate division Zixibacteria bacterium]|nr:SGNH/GDSL hydrolase family protein [candidate division Zixibacteria bacterium]
MSHGKYSLAIRLGAAAGALLLFIVVAELLVRCAGIDTYVENRFFTLNRALDYPEVFEKDRRLFWRLRPGRTVTSQFFEGRTYRINSLGLRGGEIAPHKKGRRILALGNSCTFGWGLPREKTFVGRLQDILGDEYDVVNAGVPGYSSFQGRLLFESELVGLQPDVVVIMFGWNDQWAAAWEIADKDQEFPPQIILECQNLLSRLNSYRLLKRLWLSAIERHPDSLFDRRAPVYRVGLEDFRDNLWSICHTCRARGIRPVLLTSPAPSLFEHDGVGRWSAPIAYHERYNRVTRELAASEGITIVDAAREFECYDHFFDNAAQDFIHFNASGHELIARMLAECVGQVSGPGSP